MPRKGHVPKRETLADPIYNSQLVTKFINTMMWGGKKSTAQGIFYKSMENLQAKGGDEAANANLCGFGLVFGHVGPSLKKANRRITPQIGKARRIALIHRFIAS